jgi:hypothetical protein
MRKNTGKYTFRRRLKSNTRFWIVVIGLFIKALVAVVLERLCKAFMR